MPEQIGTGGLPERADVAIVGGGYTGLGAARHLQQMGLSAVVIEQNPIGWGASSRNGGKALVGLKYDASKIVQTYGRELGEALWQASLEGIDKVEQIVREEQIDCGFERTGSVYLACKQKHFDAMQRETDWLAQNFDYQRIDVPRSSLRDEIGTAQYFGGTVDELSAGLHPAAWVRGLASATVRSGATLCANTQVTAIDHKADHWQVQTSGGSLRADQVLVATNGYTGNVEPGIQRQVLPVGSYIIATEPLSEDICALLSPRKRMFYDSNWFLKYFRITEDRRMLFGGRTTIAPDQSLTRSADLLRVDMVAMFPELKDSAITHSWSGQLGVTFDAMPHIGQHQGIWFALGYGGHGVALSTLFAEHVAQLIARKRERSIFKDIPAATRWWYRGRPWCRPFIGFGLRMLDRFG